MALRLIVDVNVGFLVEEWLRQQGYDILAVRDLDPTQPDDDILRIPAAGLKPPGYGTSPAKAG